MALDTDVFNDDIVAVIADLPASLVWTNPSGTEETISCMKSNQDRSDELEVPGIFKNKGVQVVAALSSFDDSSVYPQISDKVTLDGTELRVVNSSVNESWVILDLDRTTA